MKKYVQEATDINIWTSIKNNTFERNKDIKEFIDGLELIDESACISLDAKWGDGKTFFVRQIEEVLKYVLVNQWADEENSIEKLPSYKYLKDNEMIAKMELKHSYLPIYYNAWMYDNHSDPLMSLLLVQRILSNHHIDLPNCPSTSLSSISVATATPHSSALHMEQLFYVNIAET